MSFLEEYEVSSLLPKEDKYGLFQSDEAIYQDAYWNYITNEPTIRSQATLFLLAFMI